MYYQEMNDVPENQGTKNSPSQPSEKEAYKKGYDAGFNAGLMQGSIEAITDSIHALIKIQTEKLGM